MWYQTCSLFSLVRVLPSPSPKTHRRRSAHYALSKRCRVRLRQEHLEASAPSLVPLKASPGIFELWIKWGRSSQEISKIHGKELIKDSIPWVAITGLHDAKQTTHSLHLIASGTRNIPSNEDMYVGCRLSGNALLNASQTSTNTFKSGDVFVRTALSRKILSLTSPIGFVGSSFLSNPITNSATPLSPWLLKYYIMTHDFKNNCDQMSNGDNNGTASQPKQNSGIQNRKFATR